MKITEVKLHLLDTGGHTSWREVTPVPGLHPRRWMGGKRHRAEARSLHTWLRLITDEGIEGWHFGGGSEAQVRVECEGFGNQGKHELVGGEP